MRRIPEEERAGLYITVIVHLAVLIVLLVAGLDYSLRGENSFVLDFTKAEEIERLEQEIEKLQKEAEFQQAIAEKLEKQIGAAPAIRNVAVDRSSLKDDRGTDAKQLYEDAARLQKELSQGFDVPNEDVAEVFRKDEAPRKEEKQSTYSGPSVLSWNLEGRKASKLPIPAYRCMGAGEVTVLIAVDPTGTVMMAKVDESCSSRDGCLRNFAVRAARMSRFSASQDAPAKQMGSITYSFIAQ